MAIARGAGTEIIRSVSHKNLYTETPLIIGVQHHIYTVLSIIVYSHIQNSSASRVYCKHVGYDSFGGVSGAEHRIFQIALPGGETFVWNDKFCFNGTEPTDFSSGGLTVAADQLALAAQATATVQTLQFDMTSSDDGGQDYDIFVSYLDQDWT